MVSKQQVLLIQGGSCFDNYTDYISYLKTGRKIDLDRLKIRKTWKNTLDTKLGDNYQVFLPEMPNKLNAHYKEWSIWFSRIINLLDNNLIIIGHSLGGIFLAKFFSKNIINKKIKSLILISAPFDKAGDESLADFVLTKPLTLLSKQCQNIYLIQSKDDKVVPFAQVKKYQEQLPNAKLISFEDRGHFNQDSFPKLIKLIKET